MLHRFLPVVVLGASMLIFGTAFAQEKTKNSHVGTFMKATSDKEFVMADKGGKEHPHTLTKDAKVLGEDGKECKLAEFRKGQPIRVTTAEGDNVMVTRVEAIKSNKNER